MRAAMLRGLALVAGCGLLLGGCGGQSAPDDRLVVYSAGPRPLAESVTQAFEERTGTRVDLFAATTGQVMARLEAERYRPRADVVIFASQVAAEALKADDRLLPYPTPPWIEHTRADWHDPDHTYFATSAALVGMAFHRDAYTPDADLRPALEGALSLRLTMPSPSRSGAAGDFVVAYVLHNGEDAYTHFLDARRHGMDFAAANSQAIGTLLVGAFQGMIGAVDYLIYRQIEQGAPLVMHYPDSGSALVQRPIAIMAGTRIPGRARAFVDHYFSEDVQRQVAATHLLPARVDIPVSDVRRNAGEDLPTLLDTDITEALARQNRILRRFQIAVERAEVVR